MRVRIYGEAGPTVILLHGGPGAPGYMAPIGRRLADRFRVLEPFQRRSGGEPLTVAGHVEDLLELIRTRCDEPRPALVGSSWGGMLALAFAAEHPDRVGHLVVIGCGTFDRESRAELRANLDRRMSRELRLQLTRLEQQVADPDLRMQRMGELLQPVYSHRLITDETWLEPCDSRGYEETWNDLVALADAGRYPAAFAAIETPVLMLHGAEDPHPGRTIHSGLAEHVRDLQYHEWQDCGHYPWLEESTHEAFYEVLQQRLTRSLG